MNAFVLVVNSSSRPSYLSSSESVVDNSKLELLNTLSCQKWGAIFSYIFFR